MNLVADFYRQEESLRRLIRKLAENPGAAALDLGCKKGDVSLSLAKQVKRLIAADKEFSGDWSHLSSLNLRFVNGNALFLPFKNASFDIIVACEVLQYIEDPRPVLDEICRTLKPGGCLIVSFPVKGPLTDILNPYNLTRKIKLAIDPARKIRGKVIYHRAADILEHCRGRLTCRSFMRRGSWGFVYAAWIVENLQSLRMRLKSEKGLGVWWAENLLKPVIKLFFLLMQLDFALPLSVLSYNIVIRLEKHRKEE